MNARVQAKFFDCFLFTKKRTLPPSDVRHNKSRNSHANPFFFGTHAIQATLTVLNTTMTQTFRQTDILQIANEHGKVTVEGLADRFGVTLQTIRRDLTELADAKHLVRVHGGAVLPSGTENIEYAERRTLNEGPKQSIANLCAQHVPDGSSVFLGIGTSTEAVARALSNHSNLMIVTNNMNVAHFYSRSASHQIIVTGGMLRKSDNGLVGTFATETIRNFKFDVSVVGCSALDKNGDLLDFDVEEVAVNQTIIAHSRKSLLTADGSKFSRTAPVRVASLRHFSKFFTDLPLPPGLQELCETWETDVILPA